MAEFARNTHPGETGFVSPWRHLGDQPWPVLKGDEEQRATSISATSMSLTFSDRLITPWLQKPSVITGESAKPPRHLDPRIRGWDLNTKPWWPSVLQNQNPALLALQQSQEDARLARRESRGRRSSADSVSSSSLSYPSRRSRTLSRRSSHGQTRAREMRVLKLIRERSLPQIRLQHVSAEEDDSRVRARTWSTSLSSIGSSAQRAVKIVKLPNEHQSGQREFPYDVKDPPYSLSFDDRCVP